MVSRSLDKLKQRSDLHLPRKVWHCTGVLVIALAFENISRTAALQTMAVVTFLFVMSDILRHQIPQLNSALMLLFRPLMREYERNRMAGTSYLLIGTFIIMLFFPKDVVTLSLLFLAVADPLASYVGIKYGRDKIVGNKSLQGSLGAFVACTVIAGLYLSATGLMKDRIVIVSLLSGLVGAISELIPVKDLDDNLTFPIISSLLLWGLFYVFGGLDFVIQ